MAQTEPSALADMESLLALVRDSLDGDLALDALARLLGLFTDPAGNRLGLVEMSDGKPKVP